MAMPPHQQMAATTPALRGPAFLEPAAPHGRGNPEKHKEQSVHPTKITDPPIAGGCEERFAEAHLGAFHRAIAADRAC